MDTRQRNEETTSELLTRSKKEKGRTGSKLIVLAVALVAVVAVIAGHFLHENAKYNAQVDLAVKYYEEGNYEQAEIEFAAAVAMAPRKTKAREGLAYVEAVNGKYDKAKEDYEKLYQDTKDEKYKRAIDEVDRKTVPTDPDLKPGSQSSEPAGDTPAPAATSTSNTANDGKVLLVDGKLYYVVSDVESYFLDEDYEDFVWSGNSTLYVSEADGSNPQAVLDLDGHGVSAMYYKDGMLYVLTYVRKDELLFDYTLRWIDLATGENTGEIDLGEEMNNITVFYIEDGRIVFPFMTEGTVEYIVSVDLASKERILLSDAATDDWAEYVATDTVCADGWVYMAVYEEFTDDDGETSRGHLRLIRVRPDGSEREVFYEEFCGDRASFAVEDLSIYNGKLYVLINYYELDEEYEFKTNDTQIKVFDLSSMELIRDEQKPADDFFLTFNNVDGETFYCLIPTSKEDAILGCFDLNTGKATHLREIKLGGGFGLYLCGDRIYVECAVYGSDYDSYSNEFRVFDTNGNYITTLTGSE